MPVWHFFAFDSISAAGHLLTPLQRAVQARDLPEWQKQFKKLRQVHRRSSISVHGGPYANSKPITETAYFHGASDLQEDQIPDQDSPSLRWLLQEFVEAIAPHYLQGTFFRPRSWILGEISWPKLLISAEEHQQLTLFQRTVLGWPQWPDIPEAFGFLKHTSAVDSTYLSPESVRELAMAEQSSGLFRRLFRDTTDLPELHALARDLSALAALIELAAIQGFALYYREDGT